MKNYDIVQILHDGSFVNIFDTNGQKATFHSKQKAENERIYLQPDYDNRLEVMEQ